MQWFITLLRAVKKAGISFFVARIWEGKSFEFEQQLKRKKNQKLFVQSAIQKNI